MELPERFKADSRKIALIEYLANPRDTRTQQELADEIGVSRVAIYKWKQDPELIEAVYQRSLSLVGERLPEVLDAMVEKAIDGNVKAARLVLEQVGKSAKESKSKGNGGLTVVFEGDVPRPKEKTIDVSGGEQG